MTICPEILTVRSVDEFLIGFVVRSLATELEEHIQWLSDQYAKDVRYHSHRKRTKNAIPLQGDAGHQKKDGFRECWTEVLNWKDQDFDRPTIFDLNRLNPRRISSRGASP